MPDRIEISNPESIGNETWVFEGVRDGVFGVHHVVQGGETLSSSEYGTVPDAVAERLRENHGADSVHRCTDAALSALEPRE